MTEIDIIDSVRRDDIFGSCFKPLETRITQLVLLKVAHGLPITAKRELAIAKECLNYGEEDMKYLRRRRRACKELVVIAGRRSGKSFLDALISAYRAIFVDRSKYLSPGEKATILVIANDRIQARIVFDYIRAFLNASSKTKRYIVKEMSDEIHLKNNVVIMVKTASFRGLRGFTADTICFDECAFFRDEYSANPDRELLAAAGPCLATIPDSMLILSTTLFIKRGIVEDYDEKYFGNYDEDVIVWKSPTTLMNPKISEEYVAAKIARDPELRSEWYPEYRKGLARFLPVEAVENCIYPGRLELPFIRENRPYKAAIDAAGGSGSDSFTLGIAHRERSDVVVLDVIRERRPPFSPKDVVKEFSQVIKGYDLKSAVADRYGSEWIREAFSECGILIKNSEKTKSQFYLEALPMLLSRQAELLDLPRLKGQLVNLERRTSGGRDFVDHARGFNDDLSNVCCAALVLCAPKHSGAKFIWSDVEMY